MEQPLGIAQEAMNKQGNKNAANFTCAMDFEASFKTESNAVNNENGVLFVANGKKVKMLHLYSPKNCGGTFYRTENKVGCLIGSNEAYGWLLSFSTNAPSKKEGIKNCVVALLMS
jgi:hypothetical protein